MCWKKNCWKQNAATRQLHWCHPDATLKKQKHINILQKSHFHSCWDEHRLPTQIWSRIKVSGVELANARAYTLKLLKNVSQKKHISFQIDVVVFSQVYPNEVFKMSSACWQSFKVLSSLPVRLLIQEHQKSVKAVQILRRCRENCGEKTFVGQFTE